MAEKTRVGVKLRLGLASLPGASEKLQSSRNAEARWRSQGPVVAPHSNGASGGRLIETHRGGPVSSQSARPLPVPPLWEPSQGDTGHTHLPLNPATVVPAEERRPPAAPFPPWRCTSLATGKASLAFRKFPLCVALCRCSCASLVRMEERHGRPPCENRRSICSHGGLRAAHVRSHRRSGSDRSQITGAHLCGISKPKRARETRLV